MFVYLHIRAAPLKEELLFSSIFPEVELLDHVAIVFLEELDFFLQYANFPH